MWIIAFISQPRVITKVPRQLATAGADGRNPPQNSTAAA
jgi:hypothetical protein